MQAVNLYLDNPEIPVEDLMKVLPGPDFPTGGIMMGTEGVRNIYTTGQGRVIVRGVATIEESEGGNRGDRIIVSELPYQVNKAQWITAIAEMVKDKRIDGLSDIRDESDKDGIRVVFRVSQGDHVGSHLKPAFRLTALESSFWAINLAIVDNQPKVLTLHGLLENFVHHRIEVIRRRSEFDLKKAQEKVHILIGLLTALSKIDMIIAAIRASDSVDTARMSLVAGFGLDEPQANAILQMQLRRLAALEQQKINDEKKGLEAEILRLETILSDESNIRDEIRRETNEVAAKFGDARRTSIAIDTSDLSNEDLIEDKTVLISLTTANYIKRMDIDTYRRQRRGGHGVTGMTTKEDDGVDRVFAAEMKDYLLCFTNIGRVYWLKVYQIPESSRIAKGKPIVNLLNLKDEIVTKVIPIRVFPGRPVYVVCHPVWTGHQDPPDGIFKSAVRRHQCHRAQGKRPAGRCHRDRWYQRNRLIDTFRLQSPVPRGDRSYRHAQCLRCTGDETTGRRYDRSPHTGRKRSPPHHIRRWFWEED